MLAMTACVGKKDKSAVNENTDLTVMNSSESVDISGEWDIISVVINDTNYVKPAEQIPEVRQYVTFDSGSFLITTNCNTIQGEYTVIGDSLSIPVMLTTEMACDDMTVEDAISKVLPHVTTIEEENDSIIRLNTSSGGGYVVLRKSVSI